MPLSEKFQVDNEKLAEEFKDLHNTFIPNNLYVELVLLLYNNISRLESIRFLCEEPSEIVQINQHFEENLPNTEIIWANKE